jgi:hypothetical protein
MILPNHWSFCILTKIKYKPAKLLTQMREQFLRLIMNSVTVFSHNEIKYSRSKYRQNSAREEDEEQNQKTKMTSAKEPREFMKK